MHVSRTLTTGLLAGLLLCPLSAHAKRQPPAPIPMAPAVGTSAWCSAFGDFVQDAAILRDRGFAPWEITESLSASPIWRQTPQERRIHLEHTILYTSSRYESPAFLGTHAEIGCRRTWGLPVY